jgi:hypothetical protein
MPEEQKQARIMQLQMADAMKTGRVVSDYPSTDGQYGDYSSYHAASSSGHHEQDETAFYDASGGRGYHYHSGQGGGGDDYYPSTDGQYAQEGTTYGGAGGGGEGGVAEFGGMTAEQYADYCEQYYAQYYGQDAPREPGGKEEVEKGDGKDEPNALSLLAGYGSDKEEEEEKEKEEENAVEAGKDEAREALLQQEDKAVAG